MSKGLKGGRISGPVHALVIAAALGIGAIIAAATVCFCWCHFPWIKWGFISGGLYLVSIYVLARWIEDRRKAKDRLARGLMTLAFIAVVAPLVSLLWTVVQEGIKRFDCYLFLRTMLLSPNDVARQQQGLPAGGVLHSIIGTVWVTTIATVLSVPLGVMTAVYLTEYGGKGRLARWTTSMVDVMTGIPSIVAGLFASALFTLFLGPDHLSAVSGGVALSVLMTPVVVRSSEEMLRLVPDELREGALALGVPKWKMIVKVVLPTSASGIMTGVTLAIARVIGETAPLLLTVGRTDGVNWNPFSGSMSTLPVFTYYSYTQPGSPVEPGQERAWAAALLLVLIVAVLFTAARLMAIVLKPKGLR